MPTPPTNPPSSTPTGTPIGTPTGPDGLQAPWRLPYLEAMSEREKAAGPPAATGSFLQDAWLAPAHDQRNHIIVRSPQGLVLLNAFPYASGHLLVALGEARPSLLDYTPEQRSRLWGLVDCGMDLLQQTLEPQGVNVGLNQGRAAGAGVPSHLHVHLVPRWGGDVNFMSSIGAVRVLPASLELMGERYRARWAAIQDRWASLLER